jgi:dihydroorotate dehydrogenase
MANKLHACPVCGRKYCDLNDLARCIKAHAKDQITQAEEVEKKQKEIEALQLQNAKLIGQVRENCRKLRGLGVSASVTYFENVDTKTTRVNVKEDPIPTCVKENVGNKEDTLSNLLAELVDELEKSLGAKMTPEENKEVENAEKLLKAMFRF